MVVVAGNDHDLLARTEGSPELGQHRQRHVQHAAERALAKLDQVAKQDKPVDIAPTRRATPPERLPAQVLPPPIAHPGADRR